MKKLVPRPLRQYADFQSRMTRSQFLRWVGFLLVIYIIAAWIDIRFLPPMLGYMPFEEVENHYVTWAALLVLFIPYIASNARRLHDVNRSGWWMVFLTIPVVMVIYFNEIGFWVFGLLSDGTSLTFLPAEWLQRAMNWVPWIVFLMITIGYSPIIYFSLKKGSPQPNRFGERS